MDIDELQASYYFNVMRRIRYEDPTFTRNVHSWDYASEGVKDVWRRFIPAIYEDSRRHYRFLNTYPEYNGEELYWLMCTVARQFPDISCDRLVAWEQLEDRQRQNWKRFAEEYNKATIKRYTVNPIV